MGARRSTILAVVALVVASGLAVTTAVSAAEYDTGHADTADAALQDYPITISTNEPVRGKNMTILATATNDGKKPANMTIKIATPAGWTPTSNTSAPAASVNSYGPNATTVYNYNSPIRAGASAEASLDVMVPEDTVAGNYTVNVMVFVDGKMVNSKKMTVKVPKMMTTTTTTTTTEMTTGTGGTTTTTSGDGGGGGIPGFGIGVATLALVLVTALAARRKR